MQKNSVFEVLWWPQGLVFNKKKGKAFFLLFFGFPSGIINLKGV